MLLECLMEKELIIEQLYNEKNDLEEKCGQLLKDMELAQEHRKRMEKSYQDAINLLDEKVTGLNDYIQDLETRNTERMRRSLTPEVRIAMKLHFNIIIEKKDTFTFEITISVSNQENKEILQRISH